MQFATEQRFGSKLPCWQRFVEVLWKLASCSAPKERDSIAQGNALGKRSTENRTRPNGP
jgi:hypothetical protein